MKTVFKSIIAVLFAFYALHSAPIVHKKNKGGYAIELVSEKSLSVGSNKFFISLSKDGEVVKDAKVKVKFFMPGMPGMPYMEYGDKAKLVGDKYEASASLSMSGTWQYSVKFKTKEGKVHAIRGSLNL